MATKNPIDEKAVELVIAELAQSFVQTQMILEDLVEKLEKQSAPIDAAGDTEQQKEAKAKKRKEVAIEMQKRCMRLDRSLKSITMMANKIPDSIQVPVWVLEALESGETPLKRARMMIQVPF